MTHSLIPASYSYCQDWRRVVGASVIRFLLTATQSFSISELVALMREHPDSDLGLYELPAQQVASIVLERFSGDAPVSEALEVLGVTSPDPEHEAWTLVSAFLKGRE